MPSTEQVFYMANETILTIVGNLTADPELRFTPSGHAVANFTVASTPRTFDRATNEWKDGEALFMRCSIWREPAEHVAESLLRGSRIIVTGRLQQRSYETREGEKRTVYEMQVDEVGPSLRYATAKINKTYRNGPQAGPAGDGDPWGSSSQSDPWGSAPADSPASTSETPANVGAPEQGAFTDEPPF